MWCRIGAGRGVREFRPKTGEWTAIAGGKEGGVFIDMIDWDVMVSVEPALSGVEGTILAAFEHNGNRIEFREHRDNKTKLNILLKSEHAEFENTINALLNYFLGRFELLEGSCSHSYELERVKDLKTGEMRWCKEVKVFRQSSVEDEPYITGIDNFVKSSENSKIVKAIAFFHYAKRATYPEHAFLVHTQYRVDFPHLL